MAIIISETTMEKIEEKLDRLFKNVWKGEQAYTFLRDRLMDHFSGLSSKDINLAKKDGSTANFYGCWAFLDLLKYRGYKVRMVKIEGCILRQYVQPKI